LHVLEIFGSSEKAKETKICSEVLEAADQLRHCLAGSSGIVQDLRIRRPLYIRSGPSSPLFRFVRLKLVELVDEKDWGKTGLPYPLDHERQIALKGLNRTVNDKRIIFVSLLPSRTLNRGR